MTAFKPPFATPATDARDPLQEGLITGPSGTPIHGAGPAAAGVAVNRTRTRPSRGSVEEKNDWPLAAGRGPHARESETS